MSELGISLKDVRDNIIANQQGFPVQIIFVQETIDLPTKILLSLPEMKMPMKFLN